MRGLETEVRRSARPAVNTPIMKSKSRIVEYNLTRNYLGGSWLTINTQDKAVYEPLPTPLGLGQDITTIMEDSDSRQKIQEDIQSDQKVRVFEIMDGQNMTINPYYIDEEYFDKDKREYLQALGSEG